MSTVRWFQQTKDGHTNEGVGSIVNPYAGERWPEKVWVRVQGVVKGVFTMLYAKQCLACRQRAGLRERDLTAWQDHSSGHLRYVADCTTLRICRP